MNIFALDPCPVTSARKLCNRHVVKMVLETAQLLCSPFDPGTAPYKRTHYNHPCARWARESEENYLWLGAHGVALGNEYTRRYAKRHKSVKVIHWCLDNKVELCLPSVGITPFPLAMPDEFRSECPHRSYQLYYASKRDQWQKAGRPMRFA